MPNGQPTVNYPNVLTVDATEINPEQDTNTVVVQPPPPNWKIDVYVSPFALGDDGDGTGGTADFKNVTTVSQGSNTTLTNESVWFQIVITNIGGSTANGVTISSTLGAIPFNTNNPNTAVCPVMPTSVAKAVTFNCRYKVDAGTPGVIQNTVTVNSSNAARQPGTTSPAPRSPIARTRQGDPEPHRAQQGRRPGGVDSGRVHGGQPVRLERPEQRAEQTQTRQAFQCMAANTTMTIGR